MAFGTDHALSDSQGTDHNVRHWSNRQRLAQTYKMSQSLPTSSSPRRLGILLTQSLANSLINSIPLIVNFEQNIRWFKMWIIENLHFITGATLSEWIPSQAEHNAVDHGQSLCIFRDMCGVWGRLPVHCHLLRKCNLKVETMRHRTNFKNDKSKKLKVTFWSKIRHVIFKIFFFTIYFD